LALRIGGLASGMDTDSIVKDLMKAERMPLDKITQKRQLLEWQRDGLRDINKMLLDFRNDIFNMRLQSSYQIKSASSSMDSKISATAGTTASGTFNITSAKKATSAYNISESGISGGTKVDPKKSLYEIKGNLANSSDLVWDKFNEKVLVKNDTNSVQLAKANIDSVDGTGLTVTDKTGTSTTFTIKTGTEASPALGSDQVYLNTDTGKMTFGSNVTAGSSFAIVYDFVQKDTVNVTTDESVFFLNNGAIRSDALPDKIEVKDSGGTVVKSFTTVSGTEDNPTIGSDQVYLNTKTGKIMFGSELKEGQTFEASYKYHYFTTSMSTFNDEGKSTKTIEVKGSQSLNDFFLELNNSELGVSAFYDEYTDKVIFNRKDTGDFNVGGKELSFEGDAFLTKVLNLNETKEIGGEDASFTINGLESKRHSNSFEFNGVTFTIKEDIAAGAPPVSITVSNNTEKVFENIKGFVDKYNEMILKVNTILSEPKYSSYKPLTDAEKEDLSETQIEKWEEKAKSGLLKGDPILTSVLSGMRNDFGSNITSLAEEFNSMFDIGLSTGTYETRGRIIIDEDKLKKALTENPEQVMKIFTNKDSSHTGNGIASRLYDSVDKALKKLGDRAGSPLSFSKTDNSQIGKALKDMDSRITSFEDRLKTIEDRYWKQFTAMEKAIQRSNEQMSYLMQQFGG
jgi:flagellar hook-associated protein 2